MTNKTTTLLAIERLLGQILDLRAQVESDVSPLEDLSELCGMVEEAEDVITAIRVPAQN